MAEIVDEEKTPTLEEVARIILEEEKILQEMMRKLLMASDLANTSVNTDDLVYLDNDQSHLTLDDLFPNESTETNFFADKRKILIDVGINEFDTFRKYYDMIISNGYLNEIIEEVKHFTTKKESCVLVGSKVTSNMISEFHLSGESPETPNEDILYGSVKIKRNYSNAKGHHLISAQKIKQFECLIKEPPMIIQNIPNCVCNTDYIISPIHRCHHCSAALAENIACNYCNLVLFCSKECHIIANNRYHKYECLGFQKHFWSMKFHDHSYIAMRMMLEGVKFFKSDMRFMYDIDENGKRVRYQYPAIYKMTSNFKKFPVAEVNEMLYKVTRNLVYLIEHSLFFNNWPNNLYEMYVYIGGLMLMHYCQAQTNAFFIEYPHPQEGFGFDITSSSAKAICPTISLLNHSCYPNCFAIVCSDSIVIKALREIQRGEELTICYFEVNPTVKVSWRQKIMETFHFTKCDCQNCQRDLDTWAVYYCDTCKDGSVYLECMELEWYGVCRDCCDILDFENYKTSLRKLNEAKIAFDTVKNVEFLEIVGKYAKKLYCPKSSLLVDEYKFIAGSFNKIRFNLIHLEYGLEVYKTLDEIFPSVNRGYLQEKLNFLLTIINQPEKMIARSLSEHNCVVIRDWSIMIQQIGAILSQILPPSVKYFDKLKEKSRQVVCNIQYQGVDTRGRRRKK